MPESTALTHPLFAVALIVAALTLCALLLPTRFFPRRTLLAAAILMGAGLAAAAWAASWGSHGMLTRSDALTHASLASTLLVLFATTPPMGGKWCGSGAGVIMGAALMAIAMLASELL
jgi:hypothetical protein